ncbi:MAG: TetR family transcriptional regulator [Rhodobacter sp. CACIA14H1]|nr:MAG: TetR family transcriptional regulator [Rhodobacter sp. CACIA14H1]
MPRSYTLSDDARAGREARKQATRRALMDAARTLAAERGVEGVSVVEVGRRAGVSHSLINAYFDGKAGLIAAVVKEFNAPQVLSTISIADGAGSAEDRLRGILLGWARFDLADVQLLRVLQAHSWNWSAAAEAENREDRQALLAPLGRVVQSGQAEGRFRPELALEDALPAIWAIYTMGMRDAVFDDPVRSPEQAVAAIWGQIAALLSVR